jgi:hypothetical protein
LGYRCPKWDRPSTRKDAVAQAGSPRCTRGHGIADVSALIKVTVELAEYWAAPALTWPLSAGFVVMAPEQRDDPRFHARIVLDRHQRFGHPP